MEPISADGAMAIGGRAAVGNPDRDISFDLAFSAGNCRQLRIFGDDRSLLAELSRGNNGRDRQVPVAGLQVAVPDSYFGGYFNFVYFLPIKIKMDILAYNIVEIRRRSMKYCLFAMLLLIPFRLSAQDGPVAQKAGFIIGLSNEVTWPEGANEGPLVISVIGQSDITAELTRQAAKESAGGRKIEVKAVNISDDFSKSQIVFIAAKELTDLAAVLKRLKGAPVLTVSDAGNFAGFGVMIDFVKSDGGHSAKVSFAINKMAAREAGLKISDDLIKQAKKTYG